MQGSSSFNFGFAGAAFALGALLALAIFKLRRGARRPSIASPHFVDAVEQSPNGVLIAEAAGYRILAANSAALRSLGYTLDEARGLTLTQVLFDETGEADALHAKLRSLDPRTPLSIRQRCKNGTLV